MNKIPRRAAWTASLALLLAACGGGSPAAAPSDVLAIRATTSFGFCVGYCRSTLEISGERATYRLVDPRAALPDVERTVTVAAAEWDALRSAVDRSRIESLPGVIGCPDCADGGAESLEVVADDWSRSITFEYQAAVPSIQPLLDRVRALRERLDREVRPAP